MKLIIINNWMGEKEAVTADEYNDIPVDCKIGEIKVEEAPEGTVYASTWEHHINVLKRRALEAWENGEKSVKE